VSDPDILRSDSTLTANFRHKTERFEGGGLPWPFVWGTNAVKTLFCSDELPQSRNQCSWLSVGIQESNPLSNVICIYSGGNVSTVILLITEYL